MLVAWSTAAASVRASPAGRSAAPRLREPFGKREDHPTTLEMSPAFRGIRLPDDAVDYSERRRLGALDIQGWLDPAHGVDSTDRTLRKLGRSLAQAEAIDVKEFFESTEMYLRTRRRIRRATVVDLACGHGLTGLLFAAYEPAVERVLLVDTRRPQSFDKLLGAVEVVAPWVRSKVTFLECPIEDAIERGALRDDGSVGCLAVHACGRATDACLEVASDLHAPIAALPCCYTGTASGAPRGVRRAMGVAAAADIDRSYRMQARGFHVDWAAIPREITPLNRILVAEPRTGGRGAGISRL